MTRSNGLVFILAFLWSVFCGVEMGRGPEGLAAGLLGGAVIAIAVGLRDVARGRKG